MRVIRAKMVQLATITSIHILVHVHKNTKGETAKQVSLAKATFQILLSGSGIPILGIILVIEQSDDQNPTNKQSRCEPCASYSKFQN